LDKRKREGCRTGSKRKGGKKRGPKGWKSARKGKGVGGGRGGTKTAGKGEKSTTALDKVGGSKKHVLDKK